MSVGVFVSFGATVTGLMTALTAINTEMDKLALKGKTSTQLLGVAGAAAAAAVGVGVVEVTKKSVEMAGEFEKSTNLLVTAAGESKSSLGTVRQGILDIASSTGTTWQNLSEGMYTVEKAGYRGADGLQVLKAAAQGAAEEGAQLDTVTNAMTSVMASYHLKASDSVQVMNGIKTAAGEAKTTMEGFSSSLSTVIPIASANNISFAEVSGAIATLTQHGTSADEATQELANTIRNLAAPNRVASNEMQQLGLNVQDVQTHLGQRGLTGTIDLLVGAITSKMGPAGTVMLNSFNQSKTAAADAQTMFNALPPAAQKVAQAVMDGSESFKDYRKNAGGLDVSMKALTDQWLTTYNRANGFNQMLRQGDPAAQTFTEALKKATGGATGLNTVLMLSGENAAGFKERVDAVAKSMADGSKDVEGWDSTQKLLNQRIAEARQSVDALGIKLGMALLPSLEHVASAVATSAIWLSHHTGVAMTLGGVITGVLVAALVVWTTMLARSAAASVKQFAEMAAAGAKWALEQTSGFVKSAAAGAVWIAEHVAMAAVFIASNVAMAASATAAFIAENLATFGIVAGIALLVAGIIWVATHWSTVWGAIKDVVTVAWDWISGVLGTAWNWLVDTSTTTFNAVADVVTDVWNGISSFFEKWWPLLLVIFLPGIAVLVALWNHFHTQILDVVQTAWQLVHDYIVNPLTEAFAWVSNAVQTVATWLTGAWSLIVTATTVAWNLLKAQVTLVVIAIVAAVMEKISAMQTWLAGIWAAIQAVAAAAWAPIKSAIIDPVTQTASSLWSTVSGWAATLAGHIRDVINAAKAAAKDALMIGKAIMDGIIQGVENGVSALVSAVQSAANSALNGAKAFLGIHSPSRAFADQVGVQIPAGVAVGVQQGTATAQAAVATMVKSLIPTQGGQGIAVGALGALAAASAPSPALGASGAQGWSPSAQAAGGSDNSRWGQHESTNDLLAQLLDVLRAQPDRIADRGLMMARKG